MSEAPGTGSSTPKDSPSPKPPRSFGARHWLSCLWGQERREVTILLAVGLVTAATEGLGVMLLFPLLTLIGVSSGPSEDAGAVAGQGIPDWLQWWGSDWGVDALPVLLCVYVGLVALQGGLTYWRMVRMARLRIRFVNRLRGSLHESLLAMEWGARRRLDSGDITAILTVGINRIMGGTDEALTVVIRLILAVVIVGLAFSVAPGLTAIGLALTAGLAAVAWPVIRRAKTRGRAHGSALRHWMARMGHQLTVQKEARVFGTEAALQRDFLMGLTSVQAATLSIANAQAFLQYVSVIALASVLAILTYVGVVLLQMPTATLLVALVLFLRILPVGVQLLRAAQTFGHFLPAWDDAQQLLHKAEQGQESRETPTAVPSLALPQTGEMGRHRVMGRPLMRLSAVSVARPDTGTGSSVSASGLDPWVLRDISLDLPACGLIVLQGPSGSGKSTLMDLMLGLLAPDAGEVLVEGTRLSGADRSRWRERVGYVPQDAVLMAGTVRECLLWARPDAEDAALRDALAAAAADFVLPPTDPEGLDRAVGERGQGLSGGERRRIAIARALLREPAVLFLDEPTEGLDPNARDRVLAVLRAQAAARLVVVISHAAEVRQQADRVWLLQDSRLRSYG